MANNSLPSSSVKTLPDKLTTFGLDNTTPKSSTKEDHHQSQLEVAPLMSNYNEQIRPLLDAVDQLRHLNLMDEGIQLPTIVVVGDQSSGKSSVLESLAGISLPRGQGICTRVPLIMRLKSHLGSDQILQLEYHGKEVPTDELHISKAISDATEEIAGNGKCISNSPLTLVVKKKGVPDLTMIDLPGITRNPVHGQPENIYEQISDIIMEHISPKESIILNVISATVDFATCESIRMSKEVDKTGERTLAVVTKADQAPEGLLEKVTDDDVNIGLGYVCVRNRIGDETHEQARAKEASLFKSHHLLSKIGKSIVGIPVLAKKLVHIQANSISKCLPDIVKKITDKLNQNMSDLDKMPRNLSSKADATIAFMRVISSAKDSLRNILVRGEYCDYPDEEKMHCRARLADMLNKCLEDLQSKSPENDYGEEFLMDEIKVLMETNGISLPNFLSRTAFVTILQKKVNQVAEIPVDFMEKVWNYVEVVVVRVIVEKSESYPQLQSLTRRAAHNFMCKVKTRSLDRVKEIVKMEKFGDYSCNPEYMQTWSKLMLQQVGFMEIMNDTSKPTKLKLEIFGEVDVGHLRGYTSIVQQAFDIKMRFMAYWKIVLRRLVDNLALHLSFSIQNLVTEMDEEIPKEVMGDSGGDGGIERMLEESPGVVNKREKLNKSIKLLEESKHVVGNIMDRITAHAE